MLKHNAETGNVTGNVTLELFSNLSPSELTQERIGSSAIILRGFALTNEAIFFTALAEVTTQAPFRHMVTPGGYAMSVAMTNCGTYGWVSHEGSYHYDTHDPLTGKRWPEMPESFRKLARNAALEAGFKDFNADACLVNRYKTGARLSLHQDKDEKDFSQPIVSVSLGVPAVFLFGGLKRKDKPIRVPLLHGDVVVWGGADRLRYHGVMPLQDGDHQQFGNHRINLTFRKAV